MDIIIRYFELQDVNSKNKDILRLIMTKLNSYFIEKDNSILFKYLPELFLLLGSHLKIFEWMYAFELVGGDLALWWWSTLMSLVELSHLHRTRSSSPLGCCPCRSTSSQSTGTPAQMMALFGGLIYSLNEIGPCCDEESLVIIIQRRLIHA